MRSYNIQFHNSPGGVGDVNRRALTDELGKEMSPDPTRSGATQTLHAGDDVHAGVLPVRKLEGQFDVPGIADDAGVLLGDGGVVQHAPLGLLDTGEHPRLAAGVAVGADADVDLVGIGAGLERFGDAQDCVGGAHGDGGQVLAGGAAADGIGSGGGEGRGGVSLGGRHGGYDAQKIGRDLELHWVK